MRVSIKDLNTAIDRLNEVSGLTPDHDDYFVQGAYGGWQLMRRIPFSTAATSVTMGFVPKRQLFEMVSMMQVAIGIYRVKMEEIKDSLPANQFPPPTDTIEP